MRKGIVFESALLTVVSSIVVIACITSLLFAIPAHAESIVWNTIGPDLAHYGGKVSSRTYLISPNITIKYNVKVWRLGEDNEKLNLVASGAEVAVGTKLLYEFVPPHFTDIYWFATGKTYDTPYGDWSAGAAAPPMSERCAPKNLYAENVGSDSGGGYFMNYASLAVAPPTRSVTINGASCTTWTDGISKVCTANAPGSVNAVFNFAPTQGKFYGGHKVDKSRSTSMKYLGGPDGNGYFGLGGDRCNRRSETRAPFAFGNKTTQAAYTLNVPKRTVPHTVTIQEPDENNQPPQNPSVTAAGGSCTVGSAYTISIHSNDPDGDRVRFFVDWNGDSIPDQIVPSSGYINSGTSQSISRTYGTAGAKTVRIRAEDEQGSLSSWASLTFTCAASDLPPTSTTTPFFEEDPFPNDGDPSDGPSINDLSLRALPSLVRTGNTTKVHWSSQNMASCEVTGTNGDSWSGLNSPVSGEASSAINGLVTYTLTCRAGGNTFAKSATVNVLPSWVEK